MLTRMKARSPLASARTAKSSSAARRPPRPGRLLATWPRREERREEHRHLVGGDRKDREVGKMAVTARAYSSHSQIPMPRARLGRGRRQRYVTLKTSASSSTALHTSESAPASGKAS